VNINCHRAAACLHRQENAHSTPASSSNRQREDCRRPLRFSPPLDHKTGHYHSDRVDTQTYADTDTANTRGIHLRTDSPDIVSPSTNLYIKKLDTVYFVYLNTKYVVINVTSGVYRYAVMYDASDIPRKANSKITSSQLTYSI
jgi:hypothetical protein